MPELNPAYTVATAAKTMSIDLRNIMAYPPTSNCPRYETDIVLGNDIDITASPETSGVFTYSSPDRNTVILQAETSDLSKVATYALKLRAWFYD